MPELVVFLNKVDLLSEADAELQELVEMEVRWDFVVCVSAWGDIEKRSEERGTRGRVSAQETELHCLEKKGVRIAWFSGGKEEEKMPCFLVCLYNLYTCIPVCL